MDWPLTFDRSNVQLFTPASAVPSCETSAAWSEEFGV
jgi:hypothetical protein